MAQLCSTLRREKHRELRGRSFSASAEGERIKALVATDVNHRTGITLVPRSSKMQTLKALYESVEKQFFNTLTKKLSSLFLLVLVSALLYWVALNIRSDIMLQLRG
ncbi:Histidine kinase, HAMP region: chemotaxis sensory transducer, partial [Pseudomonas syringae pv. atrofaciens]